SRPVKTLAIETSGSPAGVGVFEGAQALACRSIPGARSLEASLVGAMDECLRGLGLTPSGLGGLAVSVGPGSYNGLRVGVSSARALASALGLPLVAVPTLDAVARRCAPPPGTTLVVAFESRRETVVWRRYRDGLPLGPAAMGSPGEACAGLEGPVWLAGNARSRYPRALADPGVTRGVDLEAPPVEAIGEMAASLAESEPHLVVPVYLRAALRPSPARGPR
ncbi:MAG: tRNA (adenosine(37)-N6)-threonylcarbamoyltransferase complex dimerization subunit type 1 TsaB, partial [Planctomycetes bacterium]|nr:tRNA (adenosine(37)-N6)-threonylcarbamoyltransferase complex dimerization subunit type 1 TsaB [Planctomycetota bacterium]